MQGRAAQSPRSKNPHWQDQEEAGPSSLLCPQWNLFPRQPGRVPGDTTWGGKSLWKGTPAPRLQSAEARFLSLNDPGQLGGLIKG